MDTTILTHFSEPVHMTVLPNGLTVLTVQRPTSEVFRSTLCVMSGHYDNVRPDCAHFLEHLLASNPDGAGEHPLYSSLHHQGLRETDASTGIFNTTLEGTTFARYARDLITAQCRMMFEPTITPLALERERRAIFGEHRGKTVQDSFWSELHTHLYPGGRVLRHLANHFEERVATTTRDDLLEHHARHFTGRRSAIACSGRITHEQVCETVHALCERLPCGKDREKLLFQHNPHIERGVTIEHRDMDSHNVMLTFAPPRRGIPKVTFNILSAALADLDYGLLIGKLRHEHGLLYGLNSRIDGWGDLFGVIELMDLKEEEMDRAREVALEVLTDISAEALREPLERIRTDCLLSMATDHEEPVSRQTILERWMDGSLEEDKESLYMAHVQNLTAEELADFAYNLFHEDRLGWITLKPG